MGELGDLGGVGSVRRGEVGVADVLAEHAVRVEEGAVHGDAVLLHARPVVFIGEERGDGVFEFGVEAFGFGGLVVSVLDGPAGDAFGAAFDPPAVEGGEGGDAVEGGLHAGGSGGLVGPERGVDPDVDALGELCAKGPVVVFEVDHLESGRGDVCRRREDVADETFAGLVGGVGFAGVQDLEAADLFGDRGEAFGVVKEEARALVGGDAAGETEGEDAGLEADAGAKLDFGEESFLADAVRARDLLRADAVDGAEVLVVGAPAGDFEVKELLERFGEPGGGVDAVGDGVDGVVGEHVLRDLAVLHGDAVGEAGEAEGEVGHVEAAVVDAAGGLDGAGAVVAEDLIHLVDPEAVVAGGDWGVSGEDADIADGVEVGGGGGADGAIG